MSQPNFQPGLVPFIPDNAPFTEEQRSWLNGYLAGMFSSAMAQPGALPEAKPAVPLTILWGSQTGNAESLARKTAKAATTKGFTVETFDMGEYDKARLKDEKSLLLITSTYGDGEPPDNAAELHAFIGNGDAPKLDGLRYSVLGLGDTNYPEFNQCAKDFDARLEKLGAQRAAPGVWCDVEFDEDYSTWLDGALSALYQESDTVDEPASASVLTTEASKTTGPKYTRDKPYLAKLLNNTTLNKDGSAKDVRHVEICLNGSDLTYEAGDALGIKPTNHPELAEEVLRLLGFSGEESVPGSTGDMVTLREALMSHYDICGLNKILLESYAPFAKSEKLDALLSGDKETLVAYLDGRHLIDSLLDFPAKFESPGDFVGLLKKLAPRLYSISSSPKAHDGQIHLTVGVVRYKTHGRDRKGVCSNFLADATPGHDLPIFIQPNKHFKPPADIDKPMIMVGPGTGIAPFRAFLHERKATSATGKNWLFFGDQKRALDFLYEEELEALQKDSVLHRLDTAFSRDTDKKVYVQDRMRENGAELFQWLEQGAYFYVCGDGSRMAKDVDAALHEIISEHANLDAEAATAYVDDLKKQKRYLRDVY